MEDSELKKESKSPSTILETLIETHNKLIERKQGKKLLKELTLLVENEDGLLSKLNEKDIEEVLFNLISKVVLNLVIDYDSIEKGDDVWFEVILVALKYDDGLNLNKLDSDNLSLLYKATVLGILNNVKILCELGVDVNLSDNDGRSPLLIASSLGHAEIVSYLLSLDQVELNQQDLNGNTALSLAIINQHLPCVIELVFNPKIDVDLSDNYGWTPLMLASHLGLLEFIEPLLAAGANRDLVAMNRKNALELALENKHSNVAKRLVSFSKISKAYSKVPKRHPDLIKNKLKEGKVKTDEMKGIEDMTKNESKSIKELEKVAKETKVKKEPVKGLNLEASFMEDLSLSSNDQLAIQAKLKRNSSIKIAKSNNKEAKETPETPQRVVEEYQDSIPTPPLDTFRKTQRHGTLRNRRLNNIKIAGLEASEKPTTNVPLSNLSAHENQPKRWYNIAGQSHWETFSKIVTFFILPSMLSRLGGIKDSSMQQAWREKVALCFIILMISLGLGFLTFGFSSLVCQKIIPIFPDQVAREFGLHSNSTKLMIVRGQLYDVGSYFPVGNHRPILPFVDEDLKDTIEPYYGHDISHLFPPDYKSSSCKFWPADIEDQCSKLGDDPKMHCHTSAESWKQLKELSIRNYVAFSWTNITSSKGLDELFVFNEMVFSLRNYLSSENQDFYFGEDLTDILKGFVGRDVTKDVLNHPKLTALIPCFEDQFLVGKLDGTTIGCFASNLVMLIATTILLTITMIKFLAALSFDWFLSWKLGKESNKPKDKDKISPLLCLVTCYSEGRDSLKTTLDSLAWSDYPDDYKILFVIADGDITGSGNAKSTPDLLLDMLTPFDQNDTNPKPKTYIAIGDGSKQLNMARVHIGYYSVSNERRTPMVLIVKCGMPTERTMPKAGNRGKRDSQLILMRFLSNICFNEKMSALEYELFEQIYRLTGFTADRFEFVLMVDADTMVLPDALSKMVTAMQKDSTVMGLCGETKIENKRQSWVTKIQVYEYYISHHLGKAFESIFGGVTCLPGCFCMYRIKVTKNDGYCVPILANPDIVTNYSSNDVSTLHKKNLLLLGEDRYLTTLMLRAFPKRKMIYVPRAICKTVVPDEFGVLLSQRRRWINSTVHNLLELVLVPQLCGIFCCSMQFVILLELIGTVVMPASLLFLSYLIIEAFMGHDVFLPLFFMACLFLLQAILIAVTTRKVSYIGWMLIYILALPIWNFVLPVYSFWHFDDFSWGATRKINGPDDGHGTRGPREDENQGDLLTLKKISEWQKQSKLKREKKLQIQLKQQQDKVKSERLRELEITKNLVNEKLNSQKLKVENLKKFQQGYTGDHIELDKEEPLQPTLVKATASPTSHGPIDTEVLFFNPQSHHEPPKSPTMAHLNKTLNDHPLPLEDIPAKPRRESPVEHYKLSHPMLGNTNIQVQPLQPITTVQGQAVMGQVSSPPKPTASQLQSLSPFDQAIKLPDLEETISPIQNTSRSIEEILPRPKTLPRGPRLDNKLKDNGLSLRWTNVNIEKEGFDRNE